MRGRAKKGTADCEGGHRLGSPFRHIRLLVATYMCGWISDGQVPPCLPHYHASSTNLHHIGKRGSLLAPSIRQ